jgi:hypothetical protein
MALTQISDLWTPAIWIAAMRERQATYPALFNSGIVSRADLFDAIASGAGTSANVPFLKDITDQADEIQVENTAPTVVNGQTGDVQVFPLLNRVTKNAVTALSAQVSGADPMGAIIDQLVMRRLKQRQTTLIAMLRGLFASAGAANAAASLSATRLGGTTAEPFTEVGANATSDQLIDPDKFIDVKALMGELGDELRNGCFLCHPNVKARLEKLDALNFKTTIMPSELPWSISTYRDIPIFTSTALARAGTTNGFVYDSYLITKGIVGYGEKPQQGDTTDTASLQYFRDRDLNNELVWDRTRLLLGINGTKWIGTPGGQSATNAELQTAANWSLVFQTANRVGATCIRTNG